MTCSGLIDIVIQAQVMMLGLGFLDALIRFLSVVAASQSAAKLVLHGIHFELCKMPSS